MHQPSSSSDSVGAHGTEQAILRAARFVDLGVLASNLGEETGVPDLPDTRPQWVRRCAAKVNAALFPHVADSDRFKLQSRPYQGGFAFALMEAGCILLARHVEKFRIKPPPRQPTDAELECAFRWLFGTDAEFMVELLKDDAAELSRAVEDFEEKLSLSELAQYHAGKSDAFKMMAGENKKNDATDIHLFMVMFWRIVDDLESVDHLYRVLSKIFGQNLVGYDPKRVAQICQRVGKRYRARGRPRKNARPGRKNSPLPKGSGLLK